jgi:hypothetical protein
VDIALGAIKEPDSDLVFEIANLLAQRRLSDMQLLRGATEVKFFCNRDNIAQQSEFNTWKHKPPCQVWYFEWYVHMEYPNHPPFTRTRFVSRLRGVKTEMSLIGNWLREDLASSSKPLTQPPKTVPHRM